MAAKRKATTAVAKLAPIVTVTEVDRPEENALGGGLEGSQRFSREMMLWHPPLISPDQQIMLEKDIADIRGRDSVQNDGYAMGALSTMRDSIVGAQYRLNSQPNLEVLGAKADEGWAEDFQTYVESRFNLLSDSEECWFDASRMNTLTGMLRLAISQTFMFGETVGTVEWIRESIRPFKTAIQQVSPTRLCNPNGETDGKFLRNGVRKDIYGRAIGYYFRRSFPNEYYSDYDDTRWTFVPTEKPWGRLQVIHILEQLQADQSRGMSDMVSVLKNMRMTKRFQEVTLQNAVVQATYAAAIESELPREVVFAMMGAGAGSLKDGLGQYMEALAAYTGAAENIQIDGVKMPHLFPGTKLNLKSMGTPGGVGTDFETSLLRHTAAALGLGYEEFSRDFSKTNYSSARASMAGTFRGTQSKKKSVADRYAKAIMTLWFEEEWNAGRIPMWRGYDPAMFYDPVMREALLSCTWIGAARGQIDEMKETQSAIMRINAGLSTYEKECALQGEDFRTVFRQRQREVKLMKKYGLEFSADATAKETMTENKKKDEDDSERENEREAALTDIIRESASIITGR